MDTLVEDDESEQDGGPLDDVDDGIEPGPGFAKLYDSDPVVGGMCRAAGIATYGDLKNIGKGLLIEIVSVLADLRKERPPKTPPSPLFDMGDKGKSDV